MDAEIGQRGIQMPYRGSGWALTPKARNAGRGAALGAALGDRMRSSVGGMLLATPLGHHRDVQQAASPMSGDW